MIFWIILTIAILAVAGVLVYAIGAWAQRRGAMSQEDCQELERLRELRHTLTTLAILNSNTDDPFPVIVLDEIDKSNRKAVTR